MLLILTLNAATMFHIPLEVSTVLGSAPRTRWELARRWGLLSGVADLNPNQTIERIRANPTERWCPAMGDLLRIGAIVGLVIAWVVR